MTSNTIRHKKKLLLLCKSIVLPVSLAGRQTAFYCISYVPSVLSADLPVYPFGLPVCLSRYV